MQVFDDTSDAFPGILRTLADLMSEHPDDQEQNGRTFSQYDEELGALRSIQKRLERRVALVGRKRNTFAPINTLPPELLVIVFAHAIDYESSTILSNNETLMLVCHSWNHTVNNTPSLWTKVRKTAATSNASVMRKLEKSKDSPLEIEYDAYSGGHLPGDQDAFLSAILPHAERWRKATLTLGGEAQGLKCLATLSTPLLESLSLRVDAYPRWDEEEPLDIFGGQLPAKLQELCLAGISVPWSSKIFCNLKALELAFIQYHGPSVDQVLAMLGTSPSLESLSIQDVTFSGGASTLLPNPAHMPFLRKLSLRIQPELTNQLLAAIRAPNCHFGDLGMSTSGDPFESLFTPGISHFFDQIRSGGHAGSITCYSHGIWIYWQGSWRISLSVDGIRTARRVLNWLSVSPEPNSLVPLHLVIWANDPLLVEDILKVMADTEGVHRVTFRVGTPVGIALRMLATGSSIEEGAREPFPVLNAMSIDKSLDDDELGDLFRILHRRQEETESNDRNQDLKPLRRLVFGEDSVPGYEEDKISEFRSIYWPKYLGEVRRLLGPEGELVWCRRLVKDDGTLGAQPVLED